MTSGEMLEWIYDDSKKKDSQYKGIMKNKEEYTTRADLMDDLQKLASKDGRHVKWMLNKGNDNIAKEADPYVKSNNNDWEQTKLTEIKDATSDEDITKIKEELKDANYETDTIARLERQLDNASKVDKTVLKSYEEKIKAAKTQQELADAVNLTAVERESNWSTRDAVSNMVALRGDELDSTEQVFEKDYTSRINGASSLSDLDRIDVSGAPTYPSEQRLQDLLDRRREELTPKEDEA